MKRLKKTLIALSCALCTALLAVPFAACDYELEDDSTPSGGESGSQEEVSASVSSVVISGTDSVTVGSAITLVATVTMSDSSPYDGDIEWESGNTSVATVSDGVVTALSAGTASITATAGGVTSDAFTVTVNEKLSVWDGSAVDTSWYTGEETTYTIETAAQLAGVASLINDSNVTFEGVTLKLDSNIDLQNNAWAALGDGTQSGLTLSAFFSGTLDGNGHTISGLTESLIAYGVNCTVKDLNITAVDSPECVVIDRIVSLGTGVTTISNVNVSGTVTEGTVYCAGAASLISHNGSATAEVVIENCTNYASVNGTDNRAVAFIGTIYNANVTFENCVNYGDLKTVSTKEAHAGMCFGYSMYEKYTGSSYQDNYVVVKNCANHGDIYAESTSDGRATAGGIAGTVHQHSAENAVTITNCVNYGNMISVNNAASGNTNEAKSGGIVGRVNSVGITIESCENYGSIESYVKLSSSAKAYAGGIIGMTDANTTKYQTVKNCVSLGSQTVSDNETGATTYNGWVVGKIAKSNNNFVLEGTITLPYSIVLTGDNLTSDSLLALLIGYNTITNYSVTIDSQNTSADSENEKWVVAFTTAVSE